MNRPCANYLRFMERGRTEWLRSLGVEQQRLHSDDVLFVVAEARLRWLTPARLDDALRVTTRPCSIGRASLLLAQAVYRGAALLVEGEVRIGCVDAGTLRARRIPNLILERLNG